jgi:hypothetical protein
MRPILAITGCAAVLTLAACGSTAANLTTPVTSRASSAATSASHAPRTLSPSPTAHPSTKRPTTAPPTVVPPPTAYVPPPSPPPPAGNRVIKAPSGNFYSAGEYCPEKDAGQTTQDAAGHTLTCVLESGRYHWTRS